MVVSGSMRASAASAAWELERQITGLLETVAVLLSLAAAGAGVECAPLPGRAPRRTARSTRRGASPGVAEAGMETAA
jgi:hypothetical protein